mmetsp:Transcript_17753/g.43420  ORF Transcript_17753/g.43420 Transcript_17753/m.43420 type:complete len:201 (+) Transcript_17753:1796-2398(+)
MQSYQSCFESTTRSTANISPSPGTNSSKSWLRFFRYATCSSIVIVGVTLSIPAPLRRRRFRVTRPTASSSKNISRSSSPLRSGSSMTSSLLISVSSSNVSSDFSSSTRSLELPSSLIMFMRSPRSSSPSSPSSALAEVPKMRSLWYSLPIRSRRISLRGSDFSRRSSARRPSSPCLASVHLSLLLSNPSPPHSKINERMP